MQSSNPFKYFHFTPLKNSDLTGVPYASDSFHPKRIKQFKITVRPRLVYIVELFNYDGYAFLKFHPKIHDSNPEKYQITNIGLKFGEIRKLLNTCCKIVLNEIEKEENANTVYSFFGQWYNKDNQLQRLSAKRFSLYEKQVTTFFSNDNFFHFKQKEINLYCLCSTKNTLFEDQVLQLLDKLTVNNDFIAQFMTDKAKELYLSFD
jgi:hypothetical protein